MVVTGLPLHLLHDFLYELWENWLSYFSLRSLFSSRTIHAVLSKSLGAVMKFMLELVALLRRIMCMFGDEDLSQQVVCPSEHSIPAFSSTFYSVSSKNC